MRDNAQDMSFRVEALALCKKKRNFVPVKMNGEVSRILISKETVSSMAAVVYPGGIEAVTVIDSVAKARIALRALRKCTHIGFDTETRPSFRRGHMNKVALLQLSSGPHCYLFRLNMPGIFDAAKPLLEDPEIIKIGLSVHDDYNALRRRGEINPAGFLDLQDYARTFHIEDISLQKIYAIVFGERISKAQRLTNWEAARLTEAQQIYAAIDAWACLKLYRYMREGHFDPYTSPYIVHEEEVSEDAAEHTDTEAAADVKSDAGVLSNDVPSMADTAAE